MSYFFKKFKYLLKSNTILLNLLDSPHNPFVDSWFIQVTTIQWTTAWMLNTLQLKKIGFINNIKTWKETDLWREIEMQRVW